ncbi:heterokaryon incompatibility protein-domain-containing protein [Durotheca rogersii]|uniref:heterokaryon incompatibility protein-domain-containing protein n=1 Tax=Durotheca rogersii TaxID=419775 RepID=UPI00221F8BDD|nr:heterokaryon incompatibility protein-domain-containing protein [Durotheca rogersii]KAI5859407.1 heterokaryon incompatibility protein-domain-containing protein [Durotheca rogersii]
MSGGKYRHFPLDHTRRDIRLLHLLPGQLSNPISCRLSHNHLDENPTYVALSYVWGDRDNLQPITLESVGFSVTLNLYTALQYLRKTDTERILWIDAICINQDDIPEREHQVSLMDQIYANAQQVFCWLGTPNDNGVVNPQGDIVVPPTTHYPGPSDEVDSFGSLTSRFGGPTSPEVQNTRSAIKFLDILSGLKEAGHPMDSGIFEYGSCGSCPSCERKGYHVEIAPLFEGAFQVLSRWVDNAWWDRVWTIQEACLAKGSWIVIYHIMIPFELLGSARYWLNIHANFCCIESMASARDPEFRVLKRFMMKVSEITRLEQVYSRQELSDHLREFRTRQAGDPRDKVNALLGMSMWTRAAPLKPNYSIETKQVYINTMMNIIEETNSLNILQGVLRPSTIPNLPSWVHDWTVGDDRDGGFRQLDGDPTLYSAGGELSKANLCRNSELLTDGFMVGKVTSVGPVCDINDAAAFINALREWERMIPENGLALDGAYTNGQSRSDAFRNTLGGDVVHGKQQLTRMLGLPPPRYVRSTEDDRELCRDWWDIIATDETQGEGVPVEWILHFEVIVTLTVRDTRFFLTDQGLMGIGPPGMNVGDKVYVLRGSGLPYILRDTDDQNPSREGCHHLARLCFNLVGSSYVHGIMDGEVLKDQTKTQVEIHSC